MKIALGADHAGYEAKQALLALCGELGHDVVDEGTVSTDSVDYPDFAAKVARAVAGGAVDVGVLVCGTGIGMSIVANKIDGVRAAKCNDPREAELARRHNDANVLCVGARILDPSVLRLIARTFLETGFDAGRHAGRVAKIDALEGPRAR